MASLHLNQLRAPCTMKTTGEAIPRQATRAFLGNGSHRQGGVSQTMTDIRTGENFNHLKLTAEKMMQEQAGVQSDLQVLRTKLQKSEDQVRTLESKVQEMNNENAMLKVKHKQDTKLWQGLDSKFLSTTTLCDQLAETVELLDIQVQEAESCKTSLEDKLAERLEFSQQTECRINDLLEKKKAAEDTVKQCEARNEQLQTMIGEMEQTILSDSIKFKTTSVEKDDLQQQLTKAVRMNDENEAILRSNRCEIQDLQNKVICNAKEATDLQHLNLTLRQANGELELDVKGLQSILATTRKENDTLQQDLEMFKLKITNLENVNTSATANIENLLAEKARFMQESEKDKVKQAKVVHELKQYLIEHKLDIEVMKHQLQEARKEKERLVDVVGNEELKFASLQDEMKRLSQEHTEKSQLISCMSQNEANLRRENTMMQEQLTAAENAAKSLEIKFNLQLESKQKESIKHLEVVLQRYNQEIADMRRKSEKEIEEAITKERLKGQDALKAAKTASDEGMAKALEAFDQRSQSLHDDCERRISNIQEGHEKEKMKILSVHAKERKKHHEELQRANETISNLQEGHEKEKMKILSVQAEERNKYHEELQRANETISNLQEGHEKEKMKILSVQAEERNKHHEELQRANERIKKLLEEQQGKTKIVCDEVRNMEEELQNVKETMKKLRESHEQDTKRIVSIHADEIHRKEVELEQIVKETISKLQEGYEQEKTTIATCHAEEIHKMQEELRAEKETCIDNIAELHRKVEEIRKSNQEEKESFHREYQAQLEKMREEKSGRHQAMKEMQLTHEELLIKKTQEQKAQFEKLEKDQQAQFEHVQKSLTRDVNEWRSKALGWEIQLKEALQQITTRKGLKEDTDVQVLNQDSKMTVTEELVCNLDVPTAVVTPMTKDKMPQQPNPRLTGKKTVDLTDTTDEDEEESQKPTPQGKRHIQQGPRPGKRKMDVRSPPEEGSRMYYRTSQKKGPLDIHDRQPIQQHQASTESTKATEVCSSRNEKASLMTRDNEPQQQELVRRQHLVDESRRKTGVTCSQQSDIHSMPGPTNQKGTRHEVLALPLEQKKTAPKRRDRKSTKDVSLEPYSPPQQMSKMELLKTPLTRAPSPAISDLFEIDGLVPYYKGDDPYAFN